MRIGINGYEAVVPRFGFDKKTGLPVRVGSSEFVFQLLSNLYKIDKKNHYKIYVPVSASGSDPQTVGLPSENATWKYVPVKKRVGPWTITALSQKLMSDKNNLDVFFSPTHYLPLYTPCPSIVAILDVSYLHFPKLFKKKDLYQLRLWGGYSIKRADKIVTISKSSKNDIIKAYGVNPDKVNVVYPGIKTQNSRLPKLGTGGQAKFKIQKMEELKKKFGIKGSYILFVGTLQPRKNIVRLIQAFAEISKLAPPSKPLATHGKTPAFANASAGRQNSNLQLVIVGKKGWQYEDILEAPKKYGVRDRVLFLENVTDEELPGLYKNALCFVLPSLYEGFGLPVLEAMKYGCPVLTSNISSLPEAGGDAALYFDPEDVNDIKKNLELIIQNSKLRGELIKKGYEQVKKFSWEKTARATLQVLQELSIKK